MSPRLYASGCVVTRKIGGDRSRGNRFFLFTQGAHAHGRDQTMPLGFANTASGESWNKTLEHAVMTAVYPSSLVAPRVARTKGKKKAAYEAASSKELG